MLTPYPCRWSDLLYLADPDKAIGCFTNLVVGHQFTQDDLPKPRQTANMVRD